MIELKFEIETGIFNKLFLQANSRDLERRLSEFNKLSIFWPENKNDIEFSACEVYTEVLEKITAIAVKQQTFYICDIDGQPVYNTDLVAMIKSQNIDYKEIPISVIEFGTDVEHRMMFTGESVMKSHNHYLEIMELLDQVWQKFEALCSDVVRKKDNKMAQLEFLDQDLYF
jgi:hypothetical protein